MQLAAKSRTATDAASRLPLVRNVSKGLGYPSARKALQASTQAIHERMHRHPALARMAAGTIEPDEYRRVLARSFGFYATAELVLGLGSGLTRSLHDDLTELGLSQAAIAALPHCMSLAIEPDPAALIGARYVLLGSSLGGKVMARAIAAGRKGQAALPLRFLTAMGETDWTTFARDLEASLPDTASRARAARAATAAFVAYEDWMAGCE